MLYYFYTLWNPTLCPPPPHTHTHIHTQTHTRARVPRPCGWFASTAPCRDQRHLFFGNSQVRHNLIIDSEWKAFLLFVCSEVKPGTALNTSSMQRHGEERRRLKSTPVPQFWDYSAWQLNVTDTTRLTAIKQNRPCTWGRGCIDPVILKLGSGWKWVLSASLSSALSLCLYVYRSEARKSREASEAAINNSI